MRGCDRMHCAMIISDGKILAMHDERSPYYYLPGGRGAIGETAENAVVVLDLKAVKLQIFL